MCLFKKSRQICFIDRGQIGVDPSTLLQIYLKKQKWSLQMIT